MERAWPSEHMSEDNRWWKGATVFIARYLASITEVTSTVKVPIVSSLKSIKYKTIILYLFDTALVVWVKDSKVWECTVCECVGRRVWWWSVESKLSVSLHSAFSQLLPSVRSYCLWTCDPWWQGVQWPHSRWVGVHLKLPPVMPSYFSITPSSLPPTITLYVCSPSNTYSFLQHPFCPSFMNQQTAAVDPSSSTPQVGLGKG